MRKSKTFDIIRIDGTVTSEVRYSAEPTEKYPFVIIGLEDGYNRFLYRVTDAKSTCVIRRFDKLAKARKFLTHLKACVDSRVLVPKFTTKNGEPSARESNVYGLTTFIYPPSGQMVIPTEQYCNKLKRIALAWVEASEKLSR
jgi:hypothetical protein